MPTRAPSGASSFQSDPSRPPNGLAEEYAALEETLRNSTVGRWFLAEHARRNRAPETQLLLDAIARLEAAVSQPQHGSDILTELTRLNEAIGQMKRELAELNPLHGSDGAHGASGALDHIVKTADQATSHILSAAEDVQKVSRSLRNLGAPREVCDRLDRDTLDIHVACASQDIAGQKTAKVVQLLNDMAHRINALVGAGGESRPSTPPSDPSPCAGGEAWRPAPDRETPGHLGGERFQRPAPLTLPELAALRRAALFG